MCTTSSNGNGAAPAFRAMTWSLPPKAQIFREGEQPSELYIVRRGWAFRYKLLFDGSRQILDFVLPGEVVGIPLNECLPYMDHSVDTATEATFCTFPLQGVLELSRSSSSFSSMLMWMASNEKARAFERITDIGRRNAHERVAHFMLDIFYRLRARNAVRTHTCEFSITQSLIADTLGLSTVHVNRVVRQLREAGVASVAGHVLTIHDLEQLENICDYDDAYLDHEVGQSLEREYHESRGGPGVGAMAFEDSGREG